MELSATLTELDSVFLSHVRKFSAIIPFQCFLRHLIFSFFFLYSFLWQSLYSTVDSLVFLAFLFVSLVKRGYKKVSVVSVVKELAVLTGNTLVCRALTTNAIKLYMDHLLLIFNCLWSDLAPWIWIWWVLWPFPRWLTPKVTPSRTAIAVFPQWATATHLSSTRLVHTGESRSCLRWGQLLLLVLILHAYFVHSLQGESLAFPNPVESI